MEIRTATARLLTAYVAHGGAEESCREEMLRLLETESPFSRAVRVHLTASAIVSCGDATLLHLHRRARRWLQPGGHVDPGEAPWETAVRETLEETGIVAAHPPQGPLLVSVDRHPAGDHVHLDLRFLLRAARLEPRPGDGESTEVGWFGWADAAVRCAEDAPLRESLRRARALAEAALPA